MKKFLVVLFVTIALAAAVQAQGQSAKPAPISPKAARDLIASNKEALLIDVRTLDEFVQGRIAGSVLLPYDQITAASAAAVIGPNKDRTLIVYCRSGRRSEIAAATLASLGYRKVLDLGGIASWPYGTISGQPKKP